MNQEIEVMQVVRIPPRGKLVVVVGDRRFERLTDVADNATRQRLMAAIGELIVFADGYDQLVNAGLAPPAASSMAENIGQRLPETMEEREAAFQATLEDQKFQMAGGSEPTLIGNEAPISSDFGSAAEASVTRDIVSEINSILQRNVNANKDLRGRIIRIEPSGTRGLGIRVDSQYYQSPDLIDEKPVRTVIKKSLTEWNRS